MPLPSHGRLLSGIVHFTGLQAELDIRWNENSRRVWNQEGAVNKDGPFLKICIFYFCRIPISQIYLLSTLSETFKDIHWLDHTILVLSLSYCFIRLCLISLVS